VTELDAIRLRRCIFLGMSVVGPSATFKRAIGVSAYRGKADVTGHTAMSQFDSSRKLPVQRSTGPTAHTDVSLLTQVEPWIRNDLSGPEGCLANCAALINE
jgi:hypothetical protein